MAGDCKSSDLVTVGSIPTTSTKSTLSRRARRVVMLSNAGNERFESSSVFLMGVYLAYRPAHGKSVTQWRRKAYTDVCMFLNVPAHNRIVCVRTMRSEIMTHRTLPLGREGRWQHESSPWSGSGWRLCVMGLGVPGS